MTPCRRCATCGAMCHGPGSGRRRCTRGVCSWTGCARDKLQGTNAATLEEIGAHAKICNEKDGKGASGPSAHFHAGTLRYAGLRLKHATNNSAHSCTAAQPVVSSTKP